MVNLTAKVEMARMNHGDNIRECAAGISEAVTELLTGPTGPKGNKRRIAETRLGKYKKGADGQPKYDPNKQVNKINGVDVSNLKATLSPRNWKKLGKEGRTYVIERRKLLNLSDGNKQGPKKQISKQEQRIAQLEQKLSEVTRRTQATAEHVHELTPVI